MRFKLSTDLRPLKYPGMILDFFKAFLSGFLLLLLVLSLVAVIAYRTEYIGGEEQTITITVDEELLNRIDEFRVEKQLDNRSAAIKKLLDRVLTEVEKPTPEKSLSDTEVEKAISEKSPSEAEVEKPTPEKRPSETEVEKATSEKSPSKEVLESK